MTFFINQLSFRNFRNYKIFNLGNLGSTVVFYGNNAVGKTNALEGIKLLTAHSPITKATSAQMIFYGESHAHIQAHIKEDKRNITLSLDIEPHSRRYFLNGNLKKPAELYGLFPSITFIPDDLELLKSSQVYKLRQFDSLGTQVNKNYRIIQRDYYKLIKNKNHLLKEENNPSLLKSINELIVICGSQLYCYRVSLFNKVKEYMKRFYKELSSNNEVFSAAYIPSWKKNNSQHGEEELSRDHIKNVLSDALEQHLQEEIVKKRAIIGPHRDSIEFYLNNQPAQIFASQGQKRSIVLAFKFAEVACIEELLSTRPVLLLDDVLGELDTKRSAALLAVLNNSQQTFITTTAKEDVLKKLHSQAIYISLPLVEAKGGDI